MRPLAVWFSSRSWAVEASARGRTSRYKTNATAAHDEIATALDRASGMTLAQIGSLLAVAVVLAAGFWQASHPTPTLAALYEEVPAWGHVALDFAPRLNHLLEAFTIGLTATITPADASWKIRASGDGSNAVSYGPRPRAAFHRRSQPIF
ncbi:hypothetical protein [Streptosporangium subroseum]|uniref:hypothetical protein n=1 Tax=Streptosporangium subroseum TaxID=106412 RepID=UPI00308FBA8A|nr:hypothetical protein OHB15_19955 [Streptosporangium subroseum]